VWLADAEHAQPVGVPPARADAAADETPRHDAKVLGVEIPQIDDIHDPKIARHSGTRFWGEPEIQALHPCG
jgi:hypothetical protein